MMIPFATRLYSCRSMQTWLRQCWYGYIKIAPRRSEWTSQKRENERTNVKLDNQAVHREEIINWVVGKVRVLHHSTSLIEKKSILLQWESFPYLTVLVSATRTTNLPASLKCLHHSPTCNTHLLISWSMIRGRDIFISRKPFGEILDTAPFGQPASITLPNFSSKWSAQTWGLLFHLMCYIYKEARSSWPIWVMIADIGVMITDIGVIIADEVCYFIWCVIYKEQGFHSRYKSWQPI